jgi:glycosyltransferase involved in cell wall biosynthesis
MNRSLSVTTHLGISGLAIAGRDHVEVLKCFYDINSIGQDFYVHGAVSLLDDTLCRKLHLSRGRKVIYFVWESSELPEATIEKLKMFDEVWTCSEYCKTIIEQYGFVVKLVPHYVKSFSKKASKTNLPTVLYAFDAESKVSRKNTFFALDVMKTAMKETKLAVVVKMLNAPSYLVNMVKSRLPQAKIVTKKLETLDDLYDNIDIVFSPHRSEGFGLFLLEGLARSKNVVASAFGGSEDFLTDANSWRIPCAVTPVHDDYYQGVWGEPDRDAAIEMLLDAVGNTKAEEAFSTALGYTFVNTLHHTEKALA